MSRFVETQIEGLNAEQLRTLFTEKTMAYEYLRVNKINKEMQRILSHEIKFIQKQLAK